MTHTMFVPKPLVERTLDLTHVGYKVPKAWLEDLTHAGYNF